MGDLKALNSFRCYLGETILPKLERYRGDVLIDLQCLYDVYIEKKELPKKIVHYVRTYGTHLYIPGVSQNDTGTYIASSVSGWAVDTTVYVLELVDGVYQVTETAPFLEWWNKVPI